MAGKESSLALANAVLLLVAAVGAVAFNGFVFMQLWNWFVPVFNSALTATYPQAWGFLLMYNFLSWNALPSVVDSTAPKKDPWKDLLVRLMGGVLILGVGYILSLYL